MNNLNQKIIKFDHDKNFGFDDFFISKSNKHIIDLFNRWPKWEKRFLNISGEKFSGKTHLINIFIKKFNGIKFEASLFNNENVEKIKIFETIILENLTENISEELIYTLFNIVDQQNKYLIITSTVPVVNINFKLIDLRSRFKDFILQSIEKPDDELLFALVVKNLSDRQISLEKKLISYIIKRIDRSYGKIFEFIYKIDEMSLKKKKSIDLKIIREALGE